MAEVPAPKPDGNEAASAAPLLQIGGFELLGKLGEGAMGTVFKARQISLDRIVALKVLPPAIAKDAQFIARFQREARASAQLNHLNIVQGIDVGQDPATGLWYFAMEYVDGPSLRRVLDKEGALPERRALELAGQVARALDCAHRSGIVHRDVKPDNILLTHNGQAKLADLGLAKRADDGPALTQSGKVVGTPHYMSPEQVKGAAGDVDIRADLYSLGATLFHLVTGQTPFDGETSASVMVKHVTEKPPLAHRVAPQVSEACSRLITHLMQKSREQRIQTPAELVAQIDRLLAEEPAARHAAARERRAPPPAGSFSAGGTPATPAPRRGLPVHWLLAGVGVLVVGVGLSLWYATAGPGGSGRQGTVEQAAAPAHSAVAVSPATSGEGAPGVLPPKPSPPATKSAPPVREPPAKLVAPVRKIEVPPDDFPPDSDQSPAKATPPEPGKTKDTRPAPPSPPTPPAEPPVPARVGRGFHGEYFTGQEFGTASGTGNEPLLNFRWPSGAPPGVALGVGPNAGASARWTGFVQPGEDGPCVFEVVANGGARLYLDNCLLLDLWTGRPSTGQTLPLELAKDKKYLLGLEWHGRYSPGGARVRWGRPGGALTIVTGEPPETEAQGAPVGHVSGGWQAEYGLPDNGQPVVTRREWTLMNEWGGGSPAPNLPVDKFWARWRGFVSPPETGDYTFGLDADDGARLFVNAVLLLDAYNGPSTKVLAAPVHLEKDRRYPVRVDYVERMYEAHCRLTWSTPDLPECPVTTVGEGRPEAPPAAEGFQAEYGVLDTPKPLLTRREVQAGWNWRGGSPAPEIPVDNFWATYTGWILAPADGVYTFSVDRDGGARLHLDDCLLLERYQRQRAVTDEIPVALTGGKYYFVRLKFNTHLYSAHLGFRWRSAEMAERLVTAVPPQAVHGGGKEAGRLETALWAEYGVGKDPLLRRLEGRVFHEFGGGGPGGDVPRDNFWGRWTAGLRVKEAGNYLFRLEADSPAELKLERVSVVKNLKLPKAESQPLPLQKGITYFLELSYSHRTYDSHIKLSWRPPGAAEYEPVPTEAFVLPPERQNYTRQVPR